jgi:parallel beta-helix repeat protein
MRFLVTAAALLCMAAGAAAATRKVPQQYLTIQEAVDAAENGDTIKVTGGPYRENVVIGGKVGLKFIGRNVVWDGNIDGSQGTCLSGTTSLHVIQGFRFRNGFPCISITGNGITIQKCSFQNGWEWAAVVAGSGLRFLKNTVVGCYQGVLNVGNDAVIEKNVFRRVYGTHLALEGSGAVVRGNTIAGYYDEGNVIAVTGNLAEVSGNTIRSCYGTMISVSGESPRVEGNSLLNGYAGIFVGGSGGVVEGNRIRSFYSFPVWVSGPSHTVRGNDVSMSYNTGINAGGDGCQVLDNRVSDVVDNDGIYVGGTATVVEGNTVSGIEGNGLNVQGDGTTVRGNRVSDAWGSRGIYVTGNGVIVVEDNVFADCLGGGIFFSGSGSRLSRNTVTGSGTYYYEGIEVQGVGNTLEDLHVDGAGNTGINVSGSGHTLTRCVVANSVINGFYVSSADTALADCSARGCGGQGLYNAGPGTTVTGSTFLGNAQDLANTGVLVNGTAGMIFQTGGEAAPPQYNGYY